MFKVVGCFLGMIQIETIVTYCDHMWWKSANLKPKHHPVIVTRTWVPVLWTSVAAVVMGFLHHSWLQVCWINVGGKSLHVIPCDHRKHVNRKVMWVCFYMFTYTLLCTYLFQALLSKITRKKEAQKWGSKKNSKSTIFRGFPNCLAHHFETFSKTTHNLDLLKVIILRILPW